jgi:hypothetical protein
MISVLLSSEDVVNRREMKFSCARDYPEGATSQTWNR